MCHNTEEWCKLWGGTGLCFAKWQDKFDKFWLNTWNSQSLYFNGLLSSKVYNVWAKKFHRNYVSWHWSVMQYLKKNWLVVWKMTRNLINFHASSRKSENLHFDGLVLSKAYKVLDEKVQKSYVSWHWRVMQSLKKNWLLVPKVTWGIWWILMPAVASPKICTLMCYFCRKYIVFEPINYKGVMCHNIEEWCKLWGGTDLCFEKWNEEFGKFWLNTWNSQNLYCNGLL